MPTEDRVAQLIEERRRQHSGKCGLLLSLGAAVLLHGGLLFALGVIDQRRDRAPVDFVAVRVVPMAEIAGHPPNPPPPSPSPAKPPEPEKQAPTLPQPKPVVKKPPATPSDRSERAAPPREAEGARSAPDTEPPAADPAASTQGSPFGLNALEGIDPEFTYDYYLEQMLGLIRRQWARPATEGKISTAVRFTVRKTGEISDLEIAEPSGFNAFDLAALRAVQNASPLPRLPASYRRGELRVTLIVR